MLIFFDESAAKMMIQVSVQLIALCIKSQFFDLWLVKR